MVCVKNLNNGREAVVRINDRGPFVGNRIIDLGHGAAQALGVSGLARVRLTILDRTSTSCRSAADVAQEIAKECKKSVVTQPHTDEAGQSFLKIVLNGSSCPATKVVPFFDGAVSKADAAPAGVFQKANNGSRVALIPLQAGASSVVIKLQTNDTVHYTLPSIAIASEPLEGAPERVDQVQDGLGIPETNTPNPSTDSGLTQDEPVSDEI
jgi:rare lipoprotein A